MFQLPARGMTRQPWARKYTYRRKRAAKVAVRAHPHLRQLAPCLWATVQQPFMCTLFTSAQCSSCTGIHGVPVLCYTTGTSTVLTFTRLILTLTTIAQNATKCTIARKKKLKKFLGGAYSLPYPIPLPSASLAPRTRRSVLFHLRLEQCFSITVLEPPMHHILLYSSYHLRRRRRFCP